MGSNWKDYPDNDYYMVSREGEVYFKGRVFHKCDGRKCTKAPRLLKQHKNKLGYSTVYLHFGDSHKREFVHIMVAKTWLPNPENKPEIDHVIPVLQGGTNAVENLRWVTHKENYENKMTREKMSQSHTGLVSNIKGRKKVWIDKNNKIYKMI